MDEKTIHNLFLDVAMRRGLMELLWSFRMEAQKKYLSVAQPMPMNMNDDQIKKELKRIIGFKRLIG